MDPARVPVAPSVACPAAPGADAPEAGVPVGSPGGVGGAVPGAGAPAAGLSGGVGPGARILIVSDAWHPQVNGVVRTLSAVRDELTRLGCAVEVIGPDRFRTVPLPTYPGIRLAVLPGRRLAGMIEAFRPDALHVATEGPLGLAARVWALRVGAGFTTSFHTRFPEYIRARTGLPAAWGYRWLRRFHGAGRGVMVAAPGLRAELVRRGFRGVLPWSRGVDLRLFRPGPAQPWPFARPVFLCVGRLAVEKGVPAFLRLPLPGTKVVVGDGPQRAALQRRFPAARFLGALHGEALARAYRAADVLVFPSRTDTFGLVLLEALACGTPVAAFPVTGPVDVLDGAGPGAGALDPDLGAAALRAWHGADPAACRAHAERFPWSACAAQFLAHLVPARG